VEGATKYLPPGGGGRPVRAGWRGSLPRSLALEHCPLLDILLGCPSTRRSFVATTSPTRGEVISDPAELGAWRNHEAASETVKGPRKP
jgi:hypothetical protein